MSDRIPTKRFFMAKLSLYLLTVFYPNYIVISYTLKDLMSFNIGILKAINTYEFIINYRAFFNIIVIISIFIIPAIGYSLEKKFINNTYKELYDAVQKLLFGLGNVVDTKRKRFCEYLSNKHEGASPEDTFKKITQPKVQILEIFNNIKYTFSSLTGDVELKMSIIYCENNRLNNYFFHSDDNPTVSVEDLKENESTAKLCLKNKKIVLIPNTSRREKDQWFYESDLNNTKSVICYPIINGKKIEYIISLTSKEKNLFKTKYRNLYDFILKEFSDRIILENYLLNLKRSHNYDE